MASTSNCGGDVPTEVSGTTESRKTKRMTLSMFRDRLLVRGSLPCPLHFKDVTGVDLKICVGEAKEWINDYFELSEVTLRCIRITVREVVKNPKYSAPVGSWMLTVEDSDEAGPLKVDHEAVSLARAKLKGFTKAVATKDGRVVLCVTPSHEACN